MKNQKERQEEIKKCVSEIHQISSDVKRLAKLFVGFRAKFRKVTQMKHCTGRHQLTLDDQVVKLNNLAKRLEKLEVTSPPIPTHWPTDLSSPPTKTPWIMWENIG